MARSDYWTKMADKSLPLQDRLVAYAYAEVEDAVETVARAYARLAAEAERDAARWAALAADVETVPVPTHSQSAVSEQVDRALARFREKEAALRMALSAKRQFERESE